MLQCKTYSPQRPLVSFLTDMETDGEILFDRIASLQDADSESEREISNYEVWQQIEERLEELADIGNDEGLPMSNPSRVDFLNFVRQVDPATRPYMSMSDRGTIHAVWTLDDGRQIGLHFLGLSKVNFVLFFSEHPDGSKCSQVGTASVDDIMQLLLRYTNLMHLLYSS